jgi:hypothetical protein
MSFFRSILVAFLLSCSALSHSSSAELASTLRISVLSFPIQYSRSLNDYKAKLETYVEEAVQNKSELLVFPETAFLNA